MRWRIPFVRPSAGVVLRMHALMNASKYPYIRFVCVCCAAVALREGHQECVDILLPLTEEPWRSGLDIFSSPSYWHDFYGATHSGDAVTVQGKRGYEWYGSHQDVQETLQEVCKSLPIDAGALCIQLGSGSSTLAEDMMQHWWQGLVVDTDLVVEALRKLNPRMHGSEAVACRFQDQVFRTGCADLVLDKGGLDALITSESWDSPLMEMGEFEPSSSHNGYCLLPSSLLFFLYFGVHCYCWRADDREPFLNLGSWSIFFLDV